MIKQSVKLFRLQIANLFGINEFLHTKDKSKKRQYVAMAVVWAFLIMILLAYVIGLSYGLVKIGMGRVLPMYLYAVVSIITLIFTFFKAGSVLFSMKGYEMLISLPISKSAVVISRFMTMYITNLLLACLVMIPGAIVYGILEKPSVIFYIVCAVGTIFLPMLPLTIASIIGAVITAISSRMRRKSIAEAILMMTLVVVIFAISALIPQDNVAISNEMLRNLAEIIEQQIGNLYPLALWFGKAAHGDVSYILGFVGMPLAIFVLFVSILQKHFQRICTLLGGVSTRNDYKIQAMTAQGVLKTLWKKELKGYFSSSVYVSNTIVGYVLAVMASVALFIVGPDKLEEVIGIAGVTPIVEVVIPFAFAILISMSTTTSSSISMEGKYFWMLQTLPVRSRDVYMSKIMTNLTVAAPFYVIMVIFGLLTVRLDIMEYVWMVVIPACYIVFISVAGITINLAFPLLNWDNEVRVVKQSASTLVTMLVGIISSIVPMACTILFGTAMADVVRAVTVVILIMITFLLHKKNGRTDIMSISSS